jgi:hypothetical protein
MTRRKTLRRLVSALVCGVWSFPGSGCTPIDWKAEEPSSLVTQGTPNLLHLP